VIFNSSNHEDIHRYYRNTFVKFKETGDTLYYIRSVNSEVVRGTDATGTEFELWLSDEHPYEVDYILPHKSFFQYKKRACLLVRVPAKQYQRGLSSSNTRVNALSKTGSVQAVELGFDVLTEFVNKQAFASLHKAVLNKAKDASITLSPRFAYVPDMKAIYADTSLVAEVRPDEKLIVVRHPIFRPEISELAKGSEFKVG
jgi:hypothetical protein